MVLCGDSTRTLGSIFQWVTPDFEVKRVFSGVVRFIDSRETGENLAKAVRLEEQRMGASGKMRDVVCDSAAINGAGVRIFNALREAAGEGKVDLRCCAAHLIDLVARLLH
jgi:hypothetical protein